MPNTVQQAYFADVATKVVLPMFKARNKPFVLVFWSRDPDGSQHNQGDSLNTVTPGINGPTSMAGIRNADDNLAQLRKALDDLGLAASTNIIITSDHGFSTISKESKSSPAAKANYDDTPKDFLPMGFLAIDLAKALDLPLFDPNDKNARVADNAHPKAGNGLLGKDPDKPDLVVATNGGSDLIYLPNKDKKLAARTIKALLEQDYVSGLFVDDKLGRFPGTLEMSQLGLKGKAVTPTPSIVVNFRSYTTGCDEPTNCSVEVADTVLRQGQGMHGSFGRGDTLNFTAAIGPDFKAGYVDPLPVSNADVGMTIAQLMGLRTAAAGGLTGRVMSEALPNGIIPKAADGNHHLQARGQRTADRRQVPARAVATLFRCGGISGTDGRPRCGRRQTKNGGEVTPPSSLADSELNLHPDVEHIRQVRQRQRRRAHNGGDQPHQGAVAAVPAAHLAGDPFQHFGIDTDRPGRRPAFDRGVRRQCNGARRHRQAGRGGGMVHDRLGQQVVETPVVAALGGRIVDLKQSFGFGPADRLMLDRGRGQDARAPGGVGGVQRAGKVNTALGGGPLAGDHAIAHHGQRLRGGVPAGNLRGLDGADQFGNVSSSGRHWYSSRFLLLVQHFHAGVNEWLTIRNLRSDIFKWLLIGRCDVRHGSCASQHGSAGGGARKRQDRGNYVSETVAVFPLRGPGSKELARKLSSLRRILSFC